MPVLACVLADNSITLRCRHTGYSTAIEQENREEMLIYKTAKIKDECACLNTSSISKTVHLLG